MRGALTYCYLSLIGYAWENRASQIAPSQPNFQITESIGYECWGIKEVVNSTWCPDCKPVPQIGGTWEGMLKAKCGSCCQGFHLPSIHMYFNLMVPGQG